MVIFTGSDSLLLLSTAINFTVRSSVVPNPSIFKVSVYKEARVFSHSPPSLSWYMAFTYNKSSSSGSL